MKKLELQNMISEERAKLHEDEMKDLMAGGLKKWYEHDKSELMSFIYWLRRQLPPTSEADYKKNWVSIVKQLQKKFPAPPDVFKQKLEEAEGPTKGFNGVAGKYQDLLKQKQDAIKVMKDFLNKEKDPAKRTPVVKKYNADMTKLNVKIAEHERRFTKAMLAIKDVDNEDDLL